MKIVVDNQILKNFGDFSNQILENSSLLNGQNCLLSFRWGSLLEYLELGSVFTTFPNPGPNEPLFEACIGALCANSNQEVISHLYDRLFTEILNQIIALPIIKPSFLLQAIQNQRQKKPFLDHPALFSPILTQYESILTEKPSDTMHDLILYLAWDRLCVCMARLFDHPSTDPHFIKGIGILRGCLIESYQHIFEQKRTTPGIYRMLEALFFYQMREENLQRHSAEEWALLSQSFHGLKQQDVLIDFFYIDDAVISCREQDQQKRIDVQYWTLASPDQIQIRLSFAQFMVNQLKRDIPDWNCVLQPVVPNHIQENKITPSEFPFS